ncbi:MAG: hypothetical protein ACJA06_001756 [Halocynthiibacter sp.]|jgi:hypothetical protein
MKHKILKQTAAALTGILLNTAAQAYSGETYVTCHLNPAGDNYLSLRECGSSKCDEIMRLGPATFMTTLEPVGTKGWREVIVMRDSQDDSYSGPSGWVYEKYICRIQE